MHTPLAWHNLTSSRGKFAMASCGVAFAVILMFMQIGFRNALLDSNVEMLKLFNADLVLVSRARFNLANETRFPREILDRVAALPGVADTCAVAIERAVAKVRVEGHTSRSIRVMCVRPSPKFFQDQSLVRLLNEAHREGYALVDRRSKSLYGFALDDEAELARQHIELNDQSLKVRDTFSLGTDFAHDGTLMMTERIFPKYFPWRAPGASPLDVVDIGLINTHGTRDIANLRDEILKLAPGQIDLYAMHEIIDRDLKFWSRNTPIGVIFGIGTIMGLIVGAIICYQIQFTDISDHMPELATLKAMGYSAGYFWSLVLCQSIYLACLGFIPGLIVSWAVYMTLAELSGLVMRMTVGRIVLVLGLTLMMCVASGILAIRKLWRADPASLF